MKNAYDRRRSTVVITQLANPRVRGSVNTYAALSDHDLISPNDVQLDFSATIAGLLPDGTLPVALLADDVTAEIKVHADQSDGDYLTITIDGTEFDLGPAVDLGNPMQVVIAKADMLALSDGPHVLGFWLQDVGDAYVGLPLTFIIDRTAPGGDQLPLIEFKKDYQENGVTLEQIAADGNVLQGNIASYDGQAAGDIISTFLKTSGDTVATPGPVLTVGDAIETHAFDFTLDMLNAAKANGDVEFWYTVEDKAGNIATARASSLRMLVFGSPDKLEAPRIPLVDDDGIIHEADARTPVNIDIPEFGHANVGDQIVVHLVRPDIAGDDMEVLAGGPLTAADLPADPENPDPNNVIRTLVIPYATLAGLQPDDGTRKMNRTSKNPYARRWALQSDAGTREKIPAFKLDVSYEVRRSIFKTHSPLYNGNVDLTLSGGPDPDPETPEHGNLKEPVITHSGADAKPNEIPVNYTAPVFATISHLSNTTPAAEVFIDGDLVQLYRLDSDGVTEIKVGAEATATAGEDVTIDFLDADVVPGTWQFFYKVGRAASGGAINEARSPNQAVVIADAGNQPGGPDLLPDAVFPEARPHASGHFAIGYTEGKDGTVVRVRKYLNMKVGDTISLTWKGYTKTRVEATEVEIKEAEHLAEKTLTEADLVEGANWDVDFPIPNAKLMQLETEQSNGTIVKGLGHARATYKVVAASGGDNTSETELTKFQALLVDVREFGA